MIEQDQLTADPTKLERERLELEQQKLQRITIAVSVVAVLVSLAQLLGKAGQNGARTASLAAEVVQKSERSQ